MRLSSSGLPSPVTIISSTCITIIVPSDPSAWYQTNNAASKRLRMNPNVPTRYPVNSSHQARGTSGSP
eukprot:3416151-Lingulodinium_polyedra.AAC.1